MKQDKKPLIQSIERALDILEMFETGKNEALRVKEISAKLGVSQNTANNIVRTLYRRGFLSQNEQLKYSLGVKCYALGVIAELMPGFKQKIFPIIQNIAVNTGDTTMAAVEHDYKLIILLYAEGSGDLVVHVRQNWMNKFHSTASGKIVLAFSEKNILDKIEKIPEFTKNTITDKKKLQKEILQIRKQGYAYCFDEGKIGISAVGVPVINKNNRFIAALGQSFPSAYIKEKKIDIRNRAEYLMQMAMEIKKII